MPAGICASKVTGPTVPVDMFLSIQLRAPSPTLSGQKRRRSRTPSAAIWPFSSMAGERSATSVICPDASSDSGAPEMPKRSSKMSFEPGT